MNILFFADTHDTLNKEEISNIKKYLSQNNTKIGTIISCGDVCDSDFKLINQEFSVASKYGVLGNHDTWTVLRDNSIDDIFNKKVDLISGLSVTGLFGSIRYKEGSVPMLSHSESMILSKDLPQANIFITHDSPYQNDYSDENKLVTDAHCGLAGIAWYLDNTPNCNIHIYGHKHEFTYTETEKYISLGIYRWAVIDIDVIGNMFIKYSYLDYWNSKNTDRNKLSIKYVNKKDENTDDNSFQRNIFGQIINRIRGYQNA